MWTPNHPDFSRMRLLISATDRLQCYRYAPDSRDSQVELLLGDNGWVEHRESGVLFSLDVTLCMFSSGNVTERTRMGKIDATGDTVVDLFCGIGYYTLPILKMAGAAKVYACEWNPHAVEALRRNLILNGIEDRCEVRQGDSRDMAPEKVADRVLLGLLPSSTCGWLTAIKCLKDSGGTLHVHENVRDVDEAGWVAQSIVDFARLASTSGRSFRVTKLHLERVKWYAPRIRHVVLDLHLAPA